MIIDPISDLLSRIRNGYLSRLSSVDVPYSRMKGEILRILKKNEYIVSYQEDTEKRVYHVELQDVRKTKYVPSFRRVSRP